MTARQSCNLRTYDLRMLGTAAWLGRMEDGDRWDAMSPAERRQFAGNKRIDKAKRELARIGIK